MQAPWQELLHWWFGQGTSANEIAAEKQRLWFGYRPQQDAEARDRFGPLVEQALDGGLQDWAELPEGWLALVLLLDQLPRMIHRNTPRAFAGDERAQQLVRDGLAHGGDMLLAPIQRVFIYLVLEHAENLAVQDLAVAHFTGLRDIADEQERSLFGGFLDYADRHREVISRFGRFPHRNAILDRESSDTERLFLEQPGSSF
ncbi:DUF924 domain-containing protein [Stutzerimonas stutzeri]|uniref:DUF924 domain-containing protein n=1 Tax=Stutzerimonas stutzeri TaxID=316 RepID=A0A2S4AP97_STUST|nr:DUF924 family protein [Stutzerimonas stutzeri]MCQ4263419.1 DUF924 domain-containing protein [Stutzerimonas stutzeri]POH83298.1 DUF924 domain-containing protein [Stutzerimonas stutzeri]